ncbi:hypothetical protein [Halococcus thailandensis]|uniref:hypothetical protein n=1 Tax=Halococcus thailandensis TaxID=335952 RepID=UPI001267E418|nr:hypothetical protein [Halococcus thailandensis]
MSSQLTDVPNTKSGVYDAWRNGTISDEQARRFFGPKWEDVLQLADVEDILASQPEVDADESDLFY